MRRNSTDKRMSALGLRSGRLACYEYTPYAARSGRDIQLMIGIAGSTHPSPATT
jgi:hypothetical protein